MNQGKIPVVADSYPFFSKCSLGLRVSPPVNPPNWAAIHPSHFHFAVRILTLRHFSQTTQPSHPVTITKEDLS